jgi:ribosomal subunit interface protein
MKVTYAGRHVELSAEQTDRLQDEFSKVGRLLDTKKGELGVRVILAHERHLTTAEAIAHYHDHELVGQGADADMFTAIHQAAGKLEAQAIRLKEKWRDGKRGAKNGENSFE